MARVPKWYARFSSQAVFTVVPIFPINLAVLGHGGIQIVCDYHYYQMMLRVNNFFLYKQEAVRSYWLPKEASEECFQLFCSLSPSNNFTITIITYS
jgi:hypothetical protein